MPKGSGVQFVEELFPIVLESPLGKGHFLMLLSVFTPLNEGGLSALSQCLSQALHIGGVTDPTIFLMVHKLWHASLREDNAGYSRSFGFHDDQAEWLLIQGRAM